MKKQLHDTKWRNASTATTTVDYINRGKYYNNNILFHNTVSDSCS